MSETVLEKLYLDSETCGLHGMPVLFQYAVDDGPIHLYDIWKRPVHETLRLIEWFCKHTIVFFNGTFDWFHVVKLYTILRLCDPDWIPEEHIDEIALLEPRGQDGPCVKPRSALDLLLFSRKGPMQSLMGRNDVRIKRVPTVLAYALADELEKRVQIDNIFFAKSHDPEAPKWQVFDRHDRYGDLDPDFKDVVLKFNPAGGLKFLTEYLLHKKPRFHYKDVEPSVRPKEVGYAPTAMAMSTPDDEWRVYAKGKDGKMKHSGYAWPGVIREVIEHWATNEDAREYAKDDVVYLRELDEHFGYPEADDNDSVLTCMVAAVRWHGFRINKPGLFLSKRRQSLTTLLSTQISRAKCASMSLLRWMTWKKSSLKRVPRRLTSKRSALGNLPSPNPALVVCWGLIQIVRVVVVLELFRPALILLLFALRRFWPSR